MNFCDDDEESQGNKRMKTNNAQWAILMDFVEQHPQMITHSFDGIGSNEVYKRLWKEISVILNSMGFGSKSPEKWITAFGKWKSRVKSKAQNLRISQNRTGGGPQPPALTPVEERLMSIIGWSVVGDKSKVLGLAESTNTTSFVRSGENEESLPSCSSLVGRNYLTGKPRTELLPEISNKKPRIHLNEKPTCNFIVEPPKLNYFEPIKQHSAESTYDSQGSSNTLLTDIETRSLGANVEKICTQSSTQSIAETTNQMLSETPKHEKTMKFSSTEKGKSIKKPTTLNSMHVETMDILRSLNNNLGRLADSQDRMAESQEKQNDILNELKNLLREKTSST